MPENNKQMKASSVTKGQVKFDFVLSENILRRTTLLSSVYIHPINHLEATQNTVAANICPHNIKATNMETTTHIRATSRLPVRATYKEPCKSSLALAVNALKIYFKKGCK